MLFIFYNFIVIKKNEVRHFHVNWDKFRNKKVRTSIIKKINIKRIR